MKNAVSGFGFSSDQKNTDAAASGIGYFADDIAGTCFK